MAHTAASNDASAQAPPSTDAPRLVVGIGASAGGVAALKDFFAAAQPATGITYVVILHLSPDHESHLAHVLQAATPLPVTAVMERVPILPDHVYVVPPNRKLGLVDGHLDVTQVSGQEERRAPIDIFLRTLGETQQERAACVILSGTGADGAMGLKRVKECGGLCIAQDPEEADFGDMPRNAIATGLVDLVLPAARIAERLVGMLRQRGSAAHATDDEAPRAQPALADIFGLLRARTGHDFSNYKRSTVLRRIERRMDVHDLATIEDYAARLRADREEAAALLKDLLISVTNFFRDAPAFAYLEREVVPRLFEGKDGNGHVRAWVAGCASGEEAYSIAMLLAERAGERLDAPSVQVFATDIDTAALARARAGLYSVPDTADVSPERLRRFFVREGDGFRIGREIREMVLFAAHNMAKDPPFSHLDLVTCRNVLIYFNRTAQERVLRLFHFGLNPGGYLFLGSAESADEGANLFVGVAKASHVYEARELHGAVPLPPFAPAPPTPPQPLAAQPDRLPARQRISYRELHQRLLEQYAPPSVVVNEDFQLVHMTRSAGRYLQFAGGEPTHHLLDVARPELRLVLHGLLHSAVRNRRRMEVVAGPLEAGGPAGLVKITASPVFGELDTLRGMILVLFEAIEDAEADLGPTRAPPAADGEPLAQQLELELLRVQSTLRTTVEQHELQQEELRASNEELQAMNEELRSSTEVLETSREELQSLNEELTTVNQELKIKIDELSHANNDLRNLMNSTDLATLFIDRSQRIKLFTPRARPLFNLIPTDVGRPFSDISHRLRYPEMAADIEAVLDTLATVEREVTAQDGSSFIVRALPYRAGDDRIAGVVLTFTDITERTRIAEVLRETDERLRLVVESAPDFAIFSLDMEGRVSSWNAGAQRMFGYSPVQIAGQPAAILFTPEDRAAGVPQEEMHAARATGRGPDERWHLRQDGTRIFVSGVLAPMVRAGVLVGYTKVARDLTDKRRAELALHAAHDSLEQRVKDRTSELADAHDSLRKVDGERLHAEQDRVQLLRQLVSAQEAERTRISRELHDQLGQEVTALSLKLAALKNAPELDPGLWPQLEGLAAMVKQLDGDIEFLVWELRPTSLTDLGLGEALRDYAGNWSRFFEIPVSLDLRLERRLAPEKETVLYRIAQEALNNVSKHAGARNVTLSLGAVGGEVELVIEDDGRGFVASAFDRRSLGLVSMRERAMLVEGSVAIETAPGKGTRIVVRVPR